MEESFAVIDRKGNLMKRCKDFGGKGIEPI